jgi:hypothetical protein
MGANELATAKPTRKEEMPGLNAKKSDGGISLNRSAAYSARCPIHPAWNIHTNNILTCFPTPFIKTLNKRYGSLVKITRQTRPKQGVNHKIYALKIRVPGRTNLSRPTCRCASRIPSQGRDSCYGNNPNLIPLCTEPASSCVAIASIVARTAQHKHTSTTCLLKDLTSNLGDFSRRLLHQI